MFTLTNTYVIDAWFLSFPLFPLPLSSRRHHSRRSNAKYSGRINYASSVRDRARSFNDTANKEDLWRRSSCRDLTRHARDGI